VHNAGLSDEIETFLPIDLIGLLEMTFSSSQVPEVHACGSELQNLQLEALVRFDFFQSRYLAHVNCLTALHKEVLIPISRRYHSVECAPHFVLCQRHAESADQQRSVAVRDSLRAIGNGQHR